MSTLPPATKITPRAITQMKASGAKIPCLTAYDYPTARLLDEAGIPLLLVGDSVGMVVLGFPDTTHVTMEHMIHHVSAVSRAEPAALVVADLPYRTYDTPDSALGNARRLQHAGAEAVKLEGGSEVIAQVRHLVDAGVPVMGHIGMLPQSIKEEGGYRVKGKRPEQRAKLLADAQALAEAGAFAMVLELVLPEAAAQITAQVRVPTIGIGSGLGCDGQILVTHDLVGLFPWFRPRFVGHSGTVGEVIRQAARGFAGRVERGEEPCGTREPDEASS